jgi:hypothetical protein
LSALFFAVEVIANVRAGMLDVVLVCVFSGVIATWNLTRILRSTAFCRKRAILSPEAEMREFFLRSSRISDDDDDPIEGAADDCGGILMRVVWALLTSAVMGLVLCIVLVLFIVPALESQVI